MLKAFEFCVPTLGTKVPARPDWIHEIKYDGYRMMVVRENDRVRLITRNGADWTNRYPWIVEAALKNRQKHFVVDGEAVVLGVDGISDFDALHSRKHDEEVQLYAFDMLSGDGEDLRKLPLSMRKTNLSPACWRAKRTASLLRRSISDRSCASSALRAWFPSATIAPTAAAGRRTGSR